LHFERENTLSEVTVSRVPIAAIVDAYKAAALRPELDALFFAFIDRAWPVAQKVILGALTLHALVLRKVFERRR